jgi:hypothetical protein
VHAPEITGAPGPELPATLTDDALMEVAQEPDPDTDAFE